MSGLLLMYLHESTLSWKEVKLGQDRDIWMKVPEAAEYFSVPKGSMYSLIQTGALPAVRLGMRSIRVNRAEAEQFLKDNRRVVS